MLLVMAAAASFPSTDLPKHPALAGNPTLSSPSQEGGLRVPCRFTTPAMLLTHQLAEDLWPQQREVGECQNLDFYFDIHLEQEGWGREERIGFQVPKVPFHKFQQKDSDARLFINAAISFFIQVMMVLKESDTESKKDDWNQRIQNETQSRLVAGLRSDSYLQLKILMSTVTSAELSFLITVFFLFLSGTVLLIALLEARLRKWKQ